MKFYSYLYACAHMYIHYVFLYINLYAYKICIYSYVTLQALPFGSPKGCIVLANLLLRKISS